MTYSIYTEDPKMVSSLDMFPAKQKPIHSSGNFMSLVHTHQKPTQKNGQKKYDASYLTAKFILTLYYF
jgi:hypothetical protein